MNFLSSANYGLRALDRHMVRSFDVSIMSQCMDITNMQATQKGLFYYLRERGAGITHISS